MGLLNVGFGSTSNCKLAKGCEHCSEGSKMVLFITGRCEAGCFYCPVSNEKIGLDVMFANEQRIRSLDEIIVEAELIGATGTGITGGDPLIEMDRTIEAIRMLKERFGPEHHIHLYTSMMDLEKAMRLEEAGLDEIRFHPSPCMWSKMDGTCLKDIAGSLRIDVGVEVPALPDMYDELCHLVKYCKSIGIGFINLNELEFSEGNWHMMDDRGYEIEDELSSAVHGSRKVALKVMKGNKGAPIHFCSSSFKDGVQLRKRLIRRAERIAKEYEAITEDGTLLKGLIYSKDAGKLLVVLKDRHNVPNEMVHLDEGRDRIEIAPWILREIAKDIEGKCYIVEEYPTADRMEVEREPLG